MQAKRHGVIAAMHHQSTAQQKRIWKETKMWLCQYLIEEPTE